MKLAGVIVAAGAAAVAAQVEPRSIYCEPDYDCKFTHVDDFGTLYEFDFTQVCDDFGYKYIDPATNYTYEFNVCGYSPRKCLPKGYPSKYVHGAAVQFMGDRPVCDLNDTATQCVDPSTNKTSCCSPDCEVLGVGTPIWSLLDEHNPARGGLKLTYTAVSTAARDESHMCPYDPDLGTNGNRDVTFIITCDDTLPTDVVVPTAAYENTTCHYVIEVKSGAACGCAPQCSGGKLCGSDQCGGYCSGVALAGSCPYGQVCMSDQTCCRPDCHNRDCGDDGCGGTCGSCGSDEYCSNAHVCISSVPYTPTAAATFAVDHGGLAGAFFGGVATVIVFVGLGWFFMGSGKTRFDAWRFSGPEGAQVKQSLVASGTASGGVAKSYGAGSYGSSSAAPAPTAMTTDL